MTRSPNTKQMRALDEAGYELIPLHRWDKRDPRTGKERGKSPVHKDWTRKPYKNAEALAHARGGNNVGVRLTAAQLVVDWDPRNDTGEWGVPSYVEFVLWNGLDPTDWPTVVTGSGGLHHYLTKPADFAVMDSVEDFPGVEFKSKGRQVVAPGSVHPSGKSYKWYEGGPEVYAGQVDMFGAPDAPQALIELIRRPSSAVAAAVAGGEYSQEEIALMLDELDPTDFQEHDDWLQIMMACHHASGGSARQEFVDWSSSDPKYKEDAWLIGRRWDSLHRKTDGPAVTHKTLDKILRDAGRGEAIPRPTPEEDFDALPEAETRDAPVATPEDEKDGNPLTRIVQEMNETYCAVLDGGQFHIFMEDFDDAVRRPVWFRMSREAFRHFHEDEKVPVPDTPRTRFPTKAEVWLESDRRRKYRGIVMDPQGLPHNDGKLNLWRGWAVEPAPGDWSMMRELIGEVLCDGDSAAEEYVVRWIAYMVQRPWETPEAAIAFRGSEGTGKGTLGRALMGIAGAHGLTVSSREQFAGRFNAHLRNCVFLFADEAVWPGDKQGEGIIKQLVTEPIISYEAKGKDITPGRNMVHLMLASNEDWIVPAGHDARRFFVSDVSERRRNDHDFFGRLWRQMDNGGLAAMLYDLKQMDLTDWRPAKNIPQTRALGDQKVLSLAPASKFWLEVLSEGALPVDAADFDGWAEGPLDLGPTDKDRLVSEYDAFLKRNRILSTRATHKALVQAGKRFGLEVNRPGGQARVWTVPSLAEMRDRFERSLGADGLFGA